MLKKRALNARFAGVCSGVLFVASGAFAAGFAEEANAQEVQAQVFMPASGVVGIVDGSFDLGDNLNVMFNGLNQTNLQVAAELVTPGLPSGTWTPRDPIVDGELPTFGNGDGTSDRLIRAGDLLRATNGGGVPFGPFRVYRKAEGLFLAATADPAELATAAGLAAGEFFLSSVSWEAKTTLAICGDDAMGYTGPDCLTMADCPNTAVNAETNECIPASEAFCMGLETPQMLNADGDMCIPIPAENGGGKSVVVSKDGRDFPVVGAIVMGLLIFGLSDGGKEGEFSYSPAFGYSVNESGYSANVGGRMDFRKDEWTLFYTGGQANANGEFGDFRYSSGGEYKTDFWQASFSESVQGERANYDFSLSADLSDGIWSLSPVYRIHSRLEEGKTETRDSLNLEGVLRYEDWRITQSAGFGWRRAEDFGDSAKFRLEAVREF